MIAMSDEVYRWPSLQDTLEVSRIIASINGRRTKVCVVRRIATLRLTVARFFNRFSVVGSKSKRLSTRYSWEEWGSNELDGLKTLF